MWISHINFFVFLCCMKVSIDNFQVLFIFKLSELCVSEGSKRMRICIWSDFAIKNVVNTALRSVNSGEIYLENHFNATKDKMNNLEFLLFKEKACILQEINGFISIHLALLFSLFSTTGKFPLILNNTTIVPVQKSNETIHVINYSPTFF